MSKRQILNTFIITITFITAFYGKGIVSSFLSISISTYYLKIIYFYSWWLIPVLLVSGFLYGFKNILSSLGINKGFFTGLVFAMITVSPMFISSAIMGQIRDIKLLNLLHSTVFAGLCEEILFRGFLFGLLFRKTGWGFIPASLSGALIFGLGHIYQGTNTGEIFGIFFITTLGAVWFSWLYAEWRYNLWVPVFLHILMNLSWTLFDVSDNALGDLYTNLFRVITIACTIVITILYNRQRGLSINRRNLIFNYKDS
jgi:uncharacterized protein